MDIKQLIDRYMDGLTTVDEERQIARYFRIERNVPDALRPYRDMFAYFDEGMPLGDVPGFDGTPLPPRRRPVRRRPVRRRMVAVWGGAVVAAAAALAALFVMPGRDTATQPLPPAVAKACVAKDTTEVVASDSVPAAPMRRDHRIVRRRYDIAPPKTYLARKNEGGRVKSEGEKVKIEKSNASAVATTNSDLLSIDQLMAQQCKIDEDNRRIAREIEESQRLVDEMRDQLVADGDFVDEDELR